MKKFRLTSSLTLGLLAGLASLELGLCGGITAAAPGAPTADTRKNPRLAQAVSPYLRQHANNPVDWYPWGPEAFQRAKAEKKLIFLSVGYSACHWCHVMERECFADPEVAAVLNQHFIAIKVDREERPDLDEIYLASFQVLGISGGWPISLFLTEDGKPIFGGTYWPKADRDLDGQTEPGFLSVLKKVNELDQKDRAGLYQQADEVAKRTAAELTQKPKSDFPWTTEFLAEILKSWEFDPQFGGFGQKLRGYRGSKFPRFPALRTWLHFADPKQVQPPLELTLRMMARRGLYDQLRGGFHRYSTERTWTVPHFEKMLYDNAQLLELYAEYRLRFPQSEFDDVLSGTVEWLNQELLGPDGLYGSSLDADSEGQEGRYYVWSAEELAPFVGTGEAADLFRRRAGLDQPPPLEDKWFVLLKLPEVTIPESLRPSVASIENRLRQAREKRTRPFRDEKCLTSWNGLTVAGLARAGQACQQPTWIDQARRTADAIHKRCQSPDGRLKRLWASVPGQPAQAHGIAFAEDYAAVMHGDLTLYEVTKNPEDLARAEQLTEILETDFASPQGGYFMTSVQGEPLFARSKDYYDGATPSANGLICRNLIRLWKITGKESYLKRFQASLPNAGYYLQNLPDQAATSAEALGLYLAHRQGQQPPATTEPKP